MSAGQILNEQLLSTLFEQSLGDDWPRVLVLFRALVPHFSIEFTNALSHAHDRGQAVVVLDQTEALLKLLHGGVIPERLTNPRDTRLYDLFLRLNSEPPHVS